MRYAFPTYVYANDLASYQAWIDSRLRALVQHSNAGLGPHSQIFESLTSCTVNVYGLRRTDNTGASGRAASSVKV